MLLLCLLRISRWLVHPDGQRGGGGMDALLICQAHQPDWWIKWDDAWMWICELISVASARILLQEKDRQWPPRIVFLPYIIYHLPASSLNLYEVN
jgi:hypothetical protein